jgi:KaiC/GvpD/RAD55 family RecA-like ATPase
MRVDSMKRISTGIKGLDEMLVGGFPFRRSVLVCGGPGSGKTVLGIQFLCKGIVEHDESGLYVSLDESAEHLKQDMSAFRWNLEKLEGKQKLAIVDASPIRTIPGEVKIGELKIGKRDFSLVSLIEIIKSRVEEIKAKRIVVDPLTTLIVQYPDISERRNAVIDLLEALTSLGTTNIMTTENRDTALGRKVTAEEFLAHGVIVLHAVHEGRELVRALQIEKMRGIPHDHEIRPYRITDEGIVVYSKETPIAVHTEAATALT